MNEKEIEIINFEITDDKSEIEKVDVDFNNTNSNLDLDKFTILRMGENLTQKNTNLKLKQGNLMYDGSKEQLFRNNELVESCNLGYPSIVSLLKDLKKKLNLK